MMKCLFLYMCCCVSVSGLDFFKASINFTVITIIMNKGYERKYKANSYRICEMTKNYRLSTSEASCDCNKSSSSKNVKQIEVFVSLSVFKTCAVFIK